MRWNSSPMAVYLGARSAYVAACVSMKSIAAGNSRMPAGRRNSGMHWAEIAFNGR